MEPVDLFRRYIPEYVLGFLPASVARENRVVPLEEDQTGTLFVAMEDPDDQDTVEKLRFILNRSVRAVLATPAGIDYAIQRYYDAAP